MECRAVSPSTGMIVDIFLAEIIPSGVARFLLVATRRSYSPSLLSSPPPENKHVLHVEEERERKEKTVAEWKGPKRGLRSPFRLLHEVAPRPFFACLFDTNAFPLYSPQLDIVSLAPSTSQRFPDGARRLAEY